MALAPLAAGVAGATILTRSKEPEVVAPEPAGAVPTPRETSDQAEVLAGVA